MDDAKLDKLIGAAERIADALEVQNALAMFAGGMIEQTPAATAMARSVMDLVTDAAQAQHNRRKLRRSMGPG